MAASRRCTPFCLARKSRAAVKGRVDPVGGRYPTRQLLLQPEAIGAWVAGNGNRFFGWIGFQIDDVMRIEFRQLSSNRPIAGRECDDTIDREVRKAR